MTFINSIINDITSDPVGFILRIVAILIALSVHEISHGFAAMKLGDPTARNLGRLSANPLKHLDPIGTICMIIFGFGWAKPVPINTRYFRKPRRDMAISAAAGPISNFIMAFGGLLIFRILLAVFGKMSFSSEFAYNVVSETLYFFNVFASVNISLGIFNLIPVPPLDGSRIFLTFLPPRQYFAIMKYERYIMLGLMVLLWFGVLDGVLGFLAGGVYDGMNALFSLIPFLR